MNTPTPVTRPFGRALLVALLFAALVAALYMLATPMEPAAWNWGICPAAGLALVVALWAISWMSKP
jgi:hypothetical protein